MNNCNSPKLLLKIYSFTSVALVFSLFFSYHPVISLGATSSMNLELSLPLILLVLFDAISLICLLRLKLLPSPFRQLRKTLFLKLTLPFLLFLTTSILWSKNPLRGILTVGVAWLVYFALLSFISLRPHLPSPLFRRIFLFTAVLASAWCWLQSILDLLGLPPTATLMCPGCITQTFGFPHPNGFAIEPQFMGNLLIAPTLYAFYRSLKVPRKQNLLLLFFFSATLFFTFSRGAIYSTALVALGLAIYFAILKHSFRPTCLLLVPFLALLFTLNAQGLFASFGSTSATYTSAISTAIEQLSLGRIRLLRPTPPPSPSSTPPPSSNAPSTPPSTPPTPPPSPPPTLPDPPHFSGYIVESTNIRRALNRSALEIWQQSPATLFFGTGLGSAGTVLYQHQKTATPKEIVQNEPLSLLLETGLVGLLLALLALFSTLKSASTDKSAPLLYALIIAYFLSCLFFSGLANTLHIFLTPVILKQNPKSSSP